MSNSKPESTMPSVVGRASHVRTIQDPTPGRRAQDRNFCDILRDCPSSWRFRCTENWTLEGWARFVVDFFRPFGGYSRRAHFALSAFSRQDFRALQTVATAQASESGSWPYRTGTYGIKLLNKIKTLATEDDYANALFDQDEITLLSTLLDHAEKSDLIEKLIGEESSNGSEHTAPSLQEGSLLGISLGYYPTYSEPSDEERQMQEREAQFSLQDRSCPNPLNLLHYLFGTRYRGGFNPFYYLGCDRNGNAETFSVTFPARKQTWLQVLGNLNLLFPLLARYQWRSSLVLLNQISESLGLGPVPDLADLDVAALSSFTEADLQKLMTVFPPNDTNDRLTDKINRLTLEDYRTTIFTLEEIGCIKDELEKSEHKRLIKKLKDPIPSDHSSLDKITNIIALVAILITTTSIYGLTSSVSSLTAGMGFFNGDMPESIAFTVLCATLSIGVNIGIDVYLLSKYLAQGLRNIWNAAVGGMSPGDFLCLARDLLLTWVGLNTIFGTAFPIYVGGLKAIRHYDFKDGLLDIASATNEGKLDVQTLFFLIPFMVYVVSTPINRLINWLGISSYPSLLKDFTEFFRQRSWLTLALVFLGFLTSYPCILALMPGVVKTVTADPNDPNSPLDTFSEGLMHAQLFGFPLLPVIQNHWLEWGTVGEIQGSPITWGQILLTLPSSVVYTLFAIGGLAVPLYFATKSLTATSLIEFAFYGLAALSYLGFGSMTAFTVITQGGKFGQFLPLLAAQSTPWLNGEGLLLLGMFAALSLLILGYSIFATCKVCLLDCYPSLDARGSNNDGQLNAPLLGNNTGRDPANSDEIGTELSSTPSRRGRAEERTVDAASHDATDPQAGAAGYQPPTGPILPSGRPTFETTGADGDFFREPRTSGKATLGQTKEPGRSWGGFFADAARSFLGLQKTYLPQEKETMRGGLFGENETEASHQTYDVEAGQASRLTATT